MSLANKEIQPTRKQEAILRFRTQCNILSSGTRGSAKTVALIIDVVDRCRSLGHEARPLVVRESHAGLLELMDELYLVCGAAFGNVTRSKADAQLHMPNGATITFTQINDIDSYSKHQGKSYCSLYLDEYGNYPVTALGFIAKLRSNLRVPPGQRPHIHCTANPFGRAHAMVHREHIKKAPFWQPYQDSSGEWWVNCHTSYIDNPWIDVESYRRQLIAAAAGDKNLLAAWEQGEWSTLGGSMFAPPWDPKIHIIKSPPYLPPAHYRIGADFGLSAPSVGLLGVKLRAPLGPYPVNSILVLDETSTCIPGSLSQGDGSPPQVLAEMFKEMMAANNRRNVQVCIDDMRGLNTAETVVSLLRENGISAHKPHNKNRAQGWVRVRSGLHNAVEAKGDAGLYITERCVGLIATISEAPRSPNRPSDIDPRWDEDHHCDGLSYLVSEFGIPPIRSRRHFGTTS